MEKFRDTLKRVYRYRSARKLLNLISWLIAVLLFFVLYFVVMRSV